MHDVPPGDARRMPPRYTLYPVAFADGDHDTNTPAIALLTVSPVGAGGRLVGGTGIGAGPGPGGNVIVGVICVTEVCMYMSSSDCCPLFMITLKSAPRSLYNVLDSNM